MTLLPPFCTMYYLPPHHLCPPLPLSDSLNQTKHSVQPFQFDVRTKVPTPPTYPLNDPAVPTTNSKAVNMTNHPCLDSRRNIDVLFRRLSRYETCEWGAERKRERVKENCWHRFRHNSTTTMPCAAYLLTCVVIGVLTTMRMMLLTWLKTVLCFFMLL